MRWLKCFEGQNDYVDWKDAWVKWRDLSPYFSATPQKFRPPHTAGKLWLLHLQDNREIMPWMDIITWKQVQKVHERAIDVISIHFSTQLPELIRPSHKAGKLWMQHRCFKSFFEASPMKKTKNKSKSTRKSMATQGVQACVNRSMPTRRLSSVKVQLTDTLVFNSKNQIHVTLGLCC